MKTLPLIVLFFFGQCLYSQKGVIKKLAFSTEILVPLATGNNFLNKGYNNPVALGLNLQVNKKKFFYEFLYQRADMNLADKKVIGNFNDAELEVFLMCVGFRQKFANTSQFLEYRVGLGQVNLKSFSSFANYTNTAVAYAVGCRYNKFLNNAFVVYGMIDFRYLAFATNDVGLQSGFYQNAYQIVPHLGVKVYLSNK